LCTGVFQLAVFADRGGLAVALRFRAVDSQRRHRPFRQQFAELLADRNQRREILDISSGKRVFDHGDRRRAPGRRRHGLSHLRQRLLDHRDNLANDGAHRFPSRFPISESFKSTSGMDRPRGDAVAKRGVWLWRRDRTCGDDDGLALQP
jgi:hypothetical protein